MRINWDRVVSMSLGIVTVILIIILIVNKSASSAIDVTSYENKIVELQSQVTELDDQVTRAHKKDLERIQHLNNEIELVKLNTLEDLYLLTNNGKGILVGDIQVDEFNLLEVALEARNIKELSHVVMKSDNYLGFIKVIEKYQPEYLFYKGSDILDEKVDMAINDLSKTGKLILPLFTPGEYDGEQIRSEVESSYKFDNVDFLTSFLVYLDGDKFIQCEFEFFGESINL